ncbi:M15 family metallopeptidase [Ensifer sp. ENS10]|uniref:tape measure protein n=1 Tax=Ensifer sp. ENS10 TaxID=2769286 RepID=UPI0017876F3E|nr:tape measure protein [Ensifer sp. ENS10]MBD9511636.1 M15 family metallopeptidase [Ensifer sp. ENS10]
MTSIRVELQLADGSFTSGMLRAGQSLAQFNSELIRTNPRLDGLADASGSVIRNMQRIDTSAKGALGTLRDISIVTGLVSLGMSKMSSAANGWLGDIVRINAEMEKLNYQMRAMSTAADPIKDAADNVKWLREQATQMPFSLKTLTSGFTKLKAVGIDPTNGSLRAISDGIAAFGGSDDAFNRTILGMTQAAGKGVLQMEELRQQIGESMPIAMNLLARSMGLTVGELAKEISTGTVASVPALQKLTAELNRAYGGTSQRMMQTFSGQMTQLYTNVQNLATSEGGRGFFDQIKNQLRDINQFLSSDMAQRMAVSFGQGLSTVVQSLREGISTIWQFRDELTRVATVAAGGLGLLAVTRGLGSLTSALQTASLNWTVFSTNMNNAMSGVAGGVSNLGRLSTAATGIRGVISGTAAVLGGLFTGFATFAPMIVGVGIAAYAAGEYFGVFSNKIKDAYDELVKFGAESRRQAEDIGNARLAQIDEQIAAQKKRMMDKGEGLTQNAAGELVPDETLGPLYLLIEERKKIQALLPQLVEDAGKKEIFRDIERYRSQVGDVLEGFQRDYNKAAIDRDKAYAEEVNKEGVREQSKKQIRDKYVADQLQQQKTLITKTTDYYDTQIAEIEKLYNRADENDKARYQARMDYLTKARVEEVAKLNSLTPEQFDMEYAKASGNETKAIEKGKTALESLHQDIAKIQANMNGASGAAAEMAERIAAQDFGSVKEGGQAVQDLHDELLAAAEAKEALDKVMKGNQKADQDLERVRQDIREQRLALIERQKGGTKLDDAQKNLLKLDNGGYYGLGPYENIRKAIGDVVGAMNAQGETANQVGVVMRQNAFGQQTEQHVMNVTNRVRELREAILGVGTGLNALNFGQLGTGIPELNGMQGNLQGMAGFTGMPTSGANLMSKNMGIFGDPRSAGWKDNNITSIMASNGMTVQVHKAAADAFKGFLDELMGQGYKVKSLGGYNVRNNVNAPGKLSEHAFGNAIDINPDQNPNGKTLVTDMPSNIRELAAKYGLTWGGDWKSVKDAMHFEWKGGQTGASTQPLRQPEADVPQFQATVFDNQIRKTEELRDAYKDAHKEYLEIGKANSDLDLSDWITKTEAETKDLGEGAEEAGKRYQQLKKAIRNGDFDKSGNPEDRKPEAKRFEAALAAAKKYDEAKKKASENDKLDKKNSQEAIKFDERRAELNRRIAEMQNKVKDPKWVPDSQELQKLQTDLDGYVADVLNRAGGDVNNATYKQALETRRNLLNGQRQLESLDAQVAFNKETESLKNSLLTQGQLRSKNLNEALAAVDTWVEQQRKNGADEVEITRMAEEQKALIRAKYAQETNPMQKQFAEWGDLQGNLAQASARWMDSLAGGIADLITGTGDFRSVLQGILKDIVNMGVKSMMSGMFSKGGQQSGGKNKGAFPAAPGGAKSKGAATTLGAVLGVPTAHTGGIIGSSALIPKAVHSNVFNSAKKFHTGGIVDSLLPSEVPIIAKKGEGVFTPEQMESMGSFAGSQTIQISSPITVNGSAGTPEQNTDLAKKMAREYEVSIRSTVADEIRKQSKVGNYMNQRSR